MTAEQITARVLQALADLGPDPDTIADRLGQLGVKGARWCDTKCPLVVYLELVDQHWVVEVTELYTTVYSWDGVSAELEPPLQITLTEPVTAFVRAFDRGHYPDLIQAVA